MFGNRAQIAISIPHARDSLTVSHNLQDAFSSISGEVDSWQHVHLSYLDVSMRECEEMKDLKGVVPCRSIHDADGCQLAAVLLLDLPI